MRIVYKILELKLKYKSLLKNNRIILTRIKIPFTYRYYR